ncbi:MAG: 16S rRNA (cytosine(1402)-N(4))-methyltransferase RsmH [Chlorobi bacterium]|nr:16S rRNA (cytosine(1402)-N(4))-methyltransferase RsmH [Chlorobiota bacterium]
MPESEYHIPVLLHKSVDGLNIKPDGIYADLTFGGGGHAQEILKHLKKGKLFAFDQDEDVTKRANELYKEFPGKFFFFKANFEYFSNFLHYAGYKSIDGILADLGVSSHQFNDSERGFSFRFDGIPDMRMNRKAKKSSVDILNEYEEEELISIFRTYGEIKSAKKLSAAIIHKREIKKIETLKQLNSLIDEVIKTQKKNKIYAQIYQALRIETNNETYVLKKMLSQSVNCLNSGGRLVVLSYHSLEDRLVKNFIKFHNFDGLQKKDIYGNPEKYFKEINKKVIVPDEEEIEKNNRSRSAKLRIAEKI